MGQTNKPTLGLKNSGDARRKLLGHEYMLQSLRSSETVTKVILIQGGSCIGKVVNFDKFTITMEIVSESTGKPTTVCLFKHGVESFGAMQ